MFILRSGFSQAVPVGRVRAFNGIQYESDIQHESTLQSVYSRQKPTLKWRQVQIVESRGLQAEVLLLANNYRRKCVIIAHPKEMCPDEGIARSFCFVKKNENNLTILT